MEKLEIIRTEAQSERPDFCDGCDNAIPANVLFFKWFSRVGGENAEGEDFDRELHSHTRAECVGEVLAKIFA